MRSYALSFVAVAFALVALLAVAPTAEACYQECVRVDPDSFCRVCMDVGTYTGVTCDGGYCACFFTQNNCSATQEEPELLAAESVMTPAQPDAAPESLLEAELPELPTLAAD